MLEVLCGLLELAEAAIRHPERIVDGRDLGVQGQGRRQVVHGAFVVALRESRPTQLDAHGRLARIDRPRLGEALLGVQRPGQVEVDTSEPDQRREVGRAKEAGALETLGRPGQVAVVPENVSEVIGPAEISRRQTLGVSKGALRLVVEPRRHESLAQLAKRVGADVWRAVRPKAFDEGRVCLAELLLNGGVEAAQIRQVDLQQRLRAGVDHSQRDPSEKRDEALSHTHGAFGASRPVPSVNVRH